MSTIMTTQRQVRDAFWEMHQGDNAISRKKNKDGDFNTDTRCAFVDFVDSLARDGQISETLAFNVTLSG